MTDPQKSQKTGESSVSFKNEITDATVNQAQTINNTYAELNTNKGEYFHQAQTINNSYIDSATRKDLRHRRQLLIRLQNDMKDLLGSTLHEWVKLDLYTESQMDQIGQMQESHPLVAKDSDMAISDNLLAEKPIQQVRNIFKTFNGEDTQGKLLILGSPGSGKTTELITLANELLQNSASDESEPLPIIFDLITWKKDLLIKDWIVQRLNKMYSLDRKRANEWVEQERIVPLLDGLDELGLAHQNECIKAINYFIRHQCLGRAVVCCRKEEYEAGEEKLTQLKTAIYLKPLEKKQIRDYLSRLGRERLWKPFCQIPELLELAKAPLFLNMLILSYKGETISRPSELLELFAEKQLNQRSNQGMYPPSKSVSLEQTKQYLKVLAGNLESEKKSDFLIEEIQPSWLSSPKERRTLRFILMGMLFPFWLLLQILFSIPSDSLLPMLSLIPLTLAYVSLGSRQNPVVPFKKVMLWGLAIGSGIGFLFAFVYGISEWPNGENELFIDGLLTGILSLIVIWLFISLLLGGMIGTGWGFGLSRLFRATDKFTFSFRRGAKWGICGGIAFSIFLLTLNAEEVSEIGVALSVIAALFLGLFTVAPLIGFLASIQVFDIQKKSFPNQAVWFSVKNSVAISLLSLIVSIGTAYITVLAIPEYDFRDGMTGILIFAMYACMFSGMGFVLRHISIRLTLYFYQKSPWNYKRFLAHAERLRFIQRVGGRYRFTHTLLRQYCSEMEV